MHEYTSQVKLYLETNIDTRSINCRAPPQHETMVRNLVETQTLCTGELLVLHRLFKTGCLLPEETLSHWEVCCVFQDTFYTTQHSDDVDTIVVKPT